MNDKISYLKKKKVAQAESKELQGQSVEKLDQLTEEIKKGFDILSQIEHPDPKVLEPEFEKINNSVVALTKAVIDGLTIKNIDKAKSDPIKVPEVKFPDWLKPVKYDDSGVVKALQDNIKILGEIKAQAEKKGQRPEDYVPFRRVKMDGKRLIFDDSQWTGGGGGGSSVTGLIPYIYDSISIPSYNANNDPLVVIYSLDGAQLARLDITYDVSNNISSVTRS